MGSLYLVNNLPGKKSPTGWMAYVAEYKALYPDKKIDYKTLMQEYIKTRQNKESE
jgi:hypothetical protein